MSSSNKPLILFDIDRTILDTNKLGENLHRHLVSKFGLSKEQIEKVYGNYKSIIEVDRYFRPKDYLKLLAESFDLNLAELENESFKRPEFYLPFYEVPEVLERLEKDFTLGIWTEGIRGFQSSKIRYLKILHLLDPDHIYIFLNKMTKNSLSKIPENSIILDDKTFNIDCLSKHGKHIPIWINRLNDDKHQKAVTVKNLLEFEEWLQKKKLSYVRM